MQCGSCRGRAIHSLAIFISLTCRCNSKTWWLAWRALGEIRVANRNGRIFAFFAASWRESLACGYFLGMRMSRQLSRWTNDNFLQNCPTGWRLVIYPFSDGGLAGLYFPWFGIGPLGGLLILFPYLLLSLSLSLSPLPSRSPYYLLLLAVVFCIYMLALHPSLSHTLLHKPHRTWLISLLPSVCFIMVASGLRL